MSKTSARWRLVALLVIALVAGAGFGGTVTFAYANGLVTSSGSTLPIGAITDGQVLCRSGSTVTSCAVASSGGLADPGSNGMLARTSTGTTAARTVTGTSNQVTVTNGSGVSGNPTLSLAASVPYYVTTAVSGAGTASCYTWNALTTGTGFTHTLPAASDGCTICWKKDNDTDAVVLARAGSDTIDGATSLSLTVAYQSVCLRGRSGAWDVF